MIDVTPDGYVGTDQQRLAASLADLAANGGGRLRLERRYTATAPLVYQGWPITVQGWGVGITGIVGQGLPPWSYVVNLLMTDFNQPVLLADFGIYTDDDSTTCGVYAQYGAADAMNNRGMHRFAMRDVELRGNDISGAWPQRGFVKGATLKNVHRPIIERVHQAGRRVGSWSEQNPWGLVMGFEFLEDGEFSAPTDVHMIGCTVYDADTPIYARGHFEGWVVDRATFVGTKCAIDIDGNPVSYPYLRVVGSHFNCYRDMIKSNCFDLSVIDNTVYKWAFPSSVGHVPSTFLVAKNANRGDIRGNRVHNLTLDYGPQTRFDFARFTDSNDMQINDNMLDGMTEGVRLLGASTGNYYRRGTWKNAQSGGGETFGFTGSNVIRA